MANYTATARTNYFSVRDVAAFAAALPGDLTIARNAHGQVAVLAQTDGGAWPTATYDDVVGDFRAFDIADLIAEHLLDRQVAILMEVGSERMSYVVGVAVAINSSGERRMVSLDDIYPLARQIGDCVTEAAWSRPTPSFPTR
jgi:hypothetical protein